MEVLLSPPLMEGKASFPSSSCNSCTLSPAMMGLLSIPGANYLVLYRANALDDLLKRARPQAQSRGQSHTPIARCEVRCQRQLKLRRWRPRNGYSQPHARSQ